MMNKQVGYSTSILIPLPDNDFEPSEAAIPWETCIKQGWDVVFSTEKGKVATADKYLLRGPILGPMGPGPKELRLYKNMSQSDAFKHPISYDDINPSKFDGVILPGGHAPGVKQYLESSMLQSKMVQFHKQGKIIGAICHGVLVISRSIDADTGHSILYGSKVTALTKDVEFMGFAITFWIYGRRYRTYPCYVADEVKQALKTPKDFKTGLATFIPFAIKDKNFVTARWPLDLNKFSNLFVRSIKKNS